MSESKEIDIRTIIESVEAGAISVDEALTRIKLKPFEDLGYAKVDIHRKLRQGVTEVIYGAGKTAAQISGIVTSLADAGQETVLITRLDAEKADEVKKNPSVSSAGFEYFDMACIGIVGAIPEATGLGKIVIATGGTSDMTVAEEAAVTCEALGNEVVRLYDVGVAGLHRLLDKKEEIMNAAVVIAIAGMEGALASVIGGIADCPVIAVPTSVGYGAAFEGLAALLSMMNSCASGVAVVNIDNGFGAGYMAHMINHMEAKR